jgi:hypothetical protein
MCSAVVIFHALSLYIPIAFNTLTDAASDIPHAEMYPQQFVVAVQPLFFAGCEHA